MDLQVGDITVESVLQKLRNREWLVPHFQREFVWEINDVISLVTSILEGRPIGMVTLWIQSQDSVLDLEPISIPDSPKEKFFQEKELNPPLVNAIIDGKQRCTAIAMAFGGFRPNNKKRKFCGRYFLKISSELDNGWEIVFLKEPEVIRKDLTKNSVSFSQGLFPLENDPEKENFVSQWMRYMDQIDNPENYEKGVLPPEGIRIQRKEIIKKVFSGLISTKLATYTLPPRYSLAEICDIFETLNTTGTRVSTVDLIHSWLYNESIRAQHDPVLLREWIDEIGNLDGAIGWASKTHRPELTVQIVTGCYISLDEKPKPRQVGRSNKPVNSLKSQDLLATPLDHWENIIENTQLLAKYIGDFQLVIAGNYFPFTVCPYPISSAMYVGLRWHHRFESPSWGIDDLNALFRAFFWMNSLNQRYDQGFLTKISADISKIKEWLGIRQNFESGSSWADKIQGLLNTYMEADLIEEKRLFNLLTDKKPSGAISNAMLLRMYSSVNKDIVDPNISLAYPQGSAATEFHHIFPRNWCKEKNHGDLKNYLDTETAGKNYVESISNLMPLSRKSNSQWRSKKPKAFIEEKNISYQSNINLFKAMFIDEVGFSILMKDKDSPGEFWHHRAKLIGKDLLNQLLIKF